MEPKLEFSTIANALLATSLLLALPSAWAHHEGGQHDVPKTAQARAAAAPAAGERTTTVEAAPDLAGGARLAATCTGCHGTNGRTVGNAIPPLAGQPKQALLASLMAFKAGERSATVMTQLAKGYSDADLERIAVFFAAQEAKSAEDAPAPKTAQPARPASGS